AAGSTWGSAGAAGATAGAAVGGCAGEPRAGRIDTTSWDAGVAALVCRGLPGRAARASTAVEMSRRVAGLPGGFGSGMVGSIRRGESGDRSHDLQDFGDVTRHLDPAPLVRERAGAVDHERGALDAAHLAAVHVLQLHDAEALAQRFVGIGDQLVGEAELRLESLVGLQAVARNAEHDGAGLDECRVVVAEVTGFVGATGSVVLRVEEQDDLAPLQPGQSDVAAGGSGAEIGNLPADRDAQRTLCRRIDNAACN